MILTMNKRPLELNGKYLGTLREANHLLGDPEALNARLDEDGYLLIRALHSRKKVENARQFLLEKLDENGQIDKSYPLSQGVSRRGQTRRIPRGQQGGNPRFRFLGRSRISGDNGFSAKRISTPP